MSEQQNRAFEQLLSKNNVIKLFIGKADDDLQL